MTGDFPNITTEWHGNTGQWQATCDEHDYIGIGDTYEEAQENLLEWLDVNESNRPNW